MTTATITNTLTDGSGTALSGVVVVARLRPGPGFRIAASTEIADVATTTNGAGVWSLALEKTANVDPANSYWEIEERLASVNGGPRSWAITVTNDSALYANLLTSLSTAAALPTALTLAAGDARYAQLGANVWTANQTLSDGVNVVLGSTTGTKFGTASTQKIGFLNATPVARQANTVDICTVLSNFGFRASGGTPPATLGAVTATTVTAAGQTSKFGLGADGSAGAYAQIDGTATEAYLSAKGTPTNIPLIMQSKGSSSVLIQTGTFSLLASIDPAGNLLQTGGMAAGGDPIGVAGYTTVSNAFGVGNAAAANLQAPAVGTGSGPASLTAVQFLKVRIGTAVHWVPAFQ